MARNLVRTSPFADISRFDPFRLDPLRSIDELMRDLTMLPALGGLGPAPGVRLGVSAMPGNNTGVSVCRRISTIKAPLRATTTACCR